MARKSLSIALAVWLASASALAGDGWVAGRAAAPAARLVSEAEPTALLRSYQGELDALIATLSP